MRQARGDMPKKMASRRLGLADYLSRAVGVAVIGKPKGPRMRGSIGNFPEIAVNLNLGRTIRLLCGWFLVWI
jgi:hypothetical protein